MFLTLDSHARSAYTGAMMTSTPQPLTVGPICLGMDFFSCDHESCNVIADVEECPDHGLEPVTDRGSGPGYTGRAIWWWTFSCGRTEMDASNDTSEVVR